MTPETSTQPDPPTPAEVEARALRMAAHAILDALPDDAMNELRDELVTMHEFYRSKTQ